MDLAVVELIMTLLVGVGLSLRAVGAHNLNLGTLDELHGLLVADGALDSIEQRRQLEREKVHGRQGNLLTFLVGILVERIVKGTVGREIATLHHGVVVVLGIVDDGHLIVRRVDWHTEVLRFGADAFANLGLEEVVTADAGETVGREVHRGVATEDRESLTARCVDRSSHIDGLAKIVGKGRTSGLPDIIVALSTGHVGTEIEGETIGRDSRIEVVVVGVAKVDFDRCCPFAGLQLFLFSFLILSVLTFFLTLGVFIFVSVFLALLALLGSGLAGLRFLGSLLFLVGSYSLGRSVDGTTMTLMLNNVASGEIDGIAIG